MVLGATGYLGTNIVKTLSSDNYQIIAVVRASSDTTHLDFPNIHFISNSKEQIEVCFKHEQIDIVINAVCTYKPNNKLYNDLLMSNLIFPLEVINLAQKYGVNKFINMGTSLPENLNMYSFSKAKLAEFGQFFSAIGKINYIDLKLEMFYGGYLEPKDRFISSCVYKLLRDEDLILTSGVQTRDIVRVEDVVGIVEKIIQDNYFAGYKSLPVGVGEAYSIQEIVNYMKKELNSNSNICLGALRERVWEPNTLANISWYADIGYKLKYHFFDGLKEECMHIKKEGLFVY